MDQTNVPIDIIMYGVNTGTLSEIHAKAVKLEHIKLKDWFIDEIE